MNPETHFDLQPTGDAPFREHTFDREHPLLGEDAFQQVLALEKKRSERSGAPVLLMLLNVQDVPRGREWKPLVSALSATLFSVTRETDIKGWYADQAILGVLCTEIGDAGLDEARDIILGKVNEHLHNLLSGEQMRRLRVTFTSFAGKEQQPLSGTMQADIRLYRKSAAGGASTAAGPPFVASFLRHWGILVAGDILAIGLACFLTAWIRTGIPFNIFEAYTGACLATLCQFLIGLFIFDQYRTRRLFREREMLTGTGLAVGLGTLLAAAFFYLAPQWQFGRGTLAIQAFLAWILLAGFRLVYSRLIVASEPRTPTLVLGNGQLGKQVIQLLSSPVSPFEVKGCLVDGDPETLGEIGSPPVVGGLDQLGEAAKDLGIQTIVIALPRHRSQRIIRKVLEARLNGIEIIDLPNLYERLAGRIPVQYIEDHWLLFADGFTLISKTTVQKLKRLVDLVFSSLLLIGLFPIAALIALAILVDSPGPVFYREERVGRNGSLFSVWRFRSMDAEAAPQGAGATLQRGPRETRVGRWLRFLRLDHLPLIWSVYKGDMSLVGPSAERPEFARELGRQIPYYSVRHTVPPGITGWAQVKYPYGTSFEDALRKLEYDLYYIKNMSILLDLKIMFRTIGIFFLGESAR